MKNKVKEAITNIVGTMGMLMGLTKDDPLLWEMAKKQIYKCKDVMDLLEEQQAEIKRLKKIIKQAGEQE